jgi:cytochrome c oxidase subunit II
MDWIRSSLLPPQGSVFAGEIDAIYMFIFWLSVVLFVGIVGTMLYFAYRYRYVAGRVTPHQTHNTRLEIIWSVLPLLLCIGMFFWGLDGYMKYTVAPGESMEIQVTGKQWLWQFEYPDGTRSVNEIHIPVNKAVHFVMTSEDVIHDFYVPDMRVKRDVIPGRYTDIWFTPTVVGQHVSTCAEYCGKGHSDMHAKLFVDTQAKYDEWMATGGDEWKNHTPEEWGKIQWDQKGCATCHTVDGTRSKGPSWKGIFGETVKLKDGKTAVVDEAYLRESMMQPNAKVVDGYEPIMPTFQGLLRENEIRGLVAYIKSLK